MNDGDLGSIIKLKFILSLFAWYLHTLEILSIPFNKCQFLEFNHTYLSFLHLYSSQEHLSKDA